LAGKQSNQPSLERRERNDLPARKEFNNGTVIVTIPNQAYPVEINQLELDVIESMPAVPIDFIPFRLVINLQFVDPSQPEKELLDFDPPIEVRIQYTKNDSIALQLLPDHLPGFWMQNTGSAALEKTQVPPGTRRHFESGGWGSKCSNWGSYMPGVRS
jgi:hypothetical protein